MSILEELYYGTFESVIGRRYDGNAEYNEAARQAMESKEHLIGVLSAENKALLERYENAVDEAHSIINYDVYKYAVWETLRFAAEAFIRTEKENLNSDI